MSYYTRTADSLNRDFRAQDSAAVHFPLPRWQAWKVLQPARAAWIEANAGSFGFATSLFHAVVRYGDLTVNQATAVDRCVARSAEVAQAIQRNPQGLTGSTVALDSTKLLEAFQTASQAGLKRTKLVYGNLTIKPAPATGRNPGCLYVSEGGTYVCRLDGQSVVFGLTWFRASNVETRQDLLTQLQALCADPAGAAAAHGHHTGRCSCCAALLTDPVSIARGIGPICAGRWGF